MKTNFGTIFGRPITSAKVIDSLNHVTFIGNLAINPTTGIVGQLYRNTITNEMLIYTDAGWMPLLDKVIDATLSEEQLCDKHPGLRQLKNELDDAKEKFESFKALLME